MSPPGAWVAAGSLAAAAGTLALVGRLRRYWEKPGARWFVAALLAQAAWAGAYGVGLFVRTPAVRLALELVVWLAIVWIAVCFLAFALAYTGRGEVLDGVWFRALLAVAGVESLAVVTNPIHGLLFRQFRTDPTFGVATVSYTHEPGAVVVLAGSMLAVVSASSLLFDTVVSYGRLYRAEAVAVGLSTLPPGVAVLAWLFKLPPYPLNLATVMFLPHLALDAYAYLGSDMFDFHPATRRAGERAAIDDLGNPVVIVDERSRVVTLNDAAAAAFDASKRTALTQPLSSLLDSATIDPTLRTQRLTVRGDGARTAYKVTSTPLRDVAASHVGYTVVFQDVTDEIRREQRLGVLTRVLRHNLRNDMGVVREYAAAASEQVDGEPAQFLARIQATADDLLELGEKARSIERVLDAGGEIEGVALASLVETVRDAATGVGSPHVVTVEAETVSVTTDPDVLEIVLEALVENAIEHGEEPVSIAVERTGSAVAVRVRDRGPGLPEHELTVLDDGAESALEHGSGLGLWIAHWGTLELDGDLAFDTGPDGTTATVTLPATDTP